jgi:hypothetical protein
LREDLPVRVTPPANPIRVRRYIRLDGLTVTSDGAGNFIGAKKYADPAAHTKIWDADLSQGVELHVGAADVALDIRNDAYNPAGVSVRLVFYDPDGVKLAQEVEFFFADLYGAANLYGAGLSAAPSGQVSAVALKAVGTGWGLSGGVTLTLKAAYLVLADLNPRP